jgi:hypothetical protein
MTSSLCRLAFFFLASLTSFFLIASPAAAGGQGFARSGVLPLDRALSPPRFAGVRVGAIELPEPDELSDCGWQDIVTNDSLRDTADLYAPLIPNGKLAEYEYAVPVVVVLQGAQVDKEQYSILGKLLAEFGFITVIPNSVRTLPLPFGTGLYSDVQVVPRAIAAVECEAGETDSPIYGIADTDTVGAVGHSLGGAAVLYAAADVCVIGFCEGCLNPYGCPGVFERPGALKAVAVYGTNLVPPPPAPPIVIQLPYDGSIPIAFLSGSVDGISTPDETEATYDTVPPVKSLVSVVDANHYGINDENNPVGAQPDLLAPGLPQRRGARRIAQTIALWLRWHLTDDLLAEDWFTNAGASLDGVVVVDDLDLVGGP